MIELMTNNPETTRSSRLHQKRRAGTPWRIASCLAALAFALPVSTAGAQEIKGGLNLLLNPNFEFHTFTSHRDGRSDNYKSHNVAFWNTEKWGDITATRAGVAPTNIRPNSAAGNLVSISPGRHITQFITLPEARLVHGDVVSLIAGGYQSEANALSARIKVMKLDSETGEWAPADFGLELKPKNYQKFARGEMVVHKTYPAESSQTGPVTLAINNAVIEGRFQKSEKSSSDHINTIGLEIEFVNNGKKGDVWVWNPCLAKGPAAAFDLPPAREMVAWYRHLPRTIQKLWKGEALHILVMGSSIDRGSANPNMMIYDENPASPTFKQPLSSAGGDTPRLNFEGEKVGRPELNKYVGWVQHYFSYAGRLRLELMRKYNLPASKLCVNFMAVDGGSVGECFALLPDYCELSQLPNSWLNGQGADALSWQELYPELFTRPEGPGPDLVIFGSGHNRNTDEPNEVAVFEGAIRWIQRHYPNTEFLFSMHSFDGEQTPNPPDLQALSLRYQIPMLDFVKPECDISRWCNQYALVPPDGHPQAAAHYLWFKQIEQAFECWDPVMPGIAQLSLPERVHPATYGWEGDALTFTGSDPRLKSGLFIYEDTAINYWGSGKLDRKSSFASGSGAFGERHIFETTPEAAKAGIVQSIICPERRFIGVNSKVWNLNALKPAPFASSVGAPYGDMQVVIPAGKSIELDPIGTDLSVAYVDAADGGTLRVIVDDKERLTTPTDQPFTTTKGDRLFLENRKPVPGLGYGWHAVRLEAVDKPVRLLGMFVYDRRSNRNGERRLTGFAAAGDRIDFSPVFATRPIVNCQGSLTCSITNVTPSAIVFSGGQGFYEIIGDGARTMPMVKEFWRPLSAEARKAEVLTTWKKVFSDDFDRSELGENYLVDKGSWQLRNGKLCALSTNDSNILVVKAASTVGDVRITFDCATLSSFSKQGACDMSYYLNLPAKTPVSYENSYFFGFGTRQNHASLLMRLDKTIALNSSILIRPGKTHNVIIERNGSRLSMSVDNQTVFAGTDPTPLAVPSETWGAFYVMRSVAEFDNLTISVPEKK